MRMSVSLWATTDADVEASLQAMMGGDLRLSRTGNAEVAG
jgi:hypothetical protein